MFPRLRILVPLMAVLLFFGGAVQAAVFQHVERSDQFTTTITIPNDPLVKGLNVVTIDVVDGGGAPVTDAKVKVKYNMKPMVGMMPMNMKATGKLSGQSYEANLEMIHSGLWDVEVRVRRAGENALKAAFAVRVEE